MKIIYCKPSKKVQFKLLEFFVAQVAARTASDLLRIQHNSSALFYHKIRLVIESHLALEVKELFDDEVGLDGSCFGGRCKGKRGCGASRSVFGLLKRDGKIFVVVVKDTKQNTLIPTIKSKVKPDSIVCTPIQATNQKRAC